MQIIEVNSFDELIRIFHRFDSVFPNLSKSDSLIEYIKKISKFGRSFVYYDDIKNDYAGLCCAYMNDKITNTAYITLIGVSRDYRRMHVGSKLINYCENQAKLAEMQFMRLEVQKNNINAQEFYKSCGYITEAERDNSYILKKELA